MDTTTPAFDILEFLVSTAGAPADPVPDAPTKPAACKQVPHHNVGRYATGTVTTCAGLSCPLHGAR